MVCCWVPFPPFSWMWSNKCWTASETNNIFLGWSSKNAPLNRTEWTGVNLKKPNLSKGTDQSCTFLFAASCRIQVKAISVPVSVLSLSHLYKEMLLFTLPALYLPHKLTLQDWQKRVCLISDSLWGNVFVFQRNLVLQIHCYCIHASWRERKGCQEKHRYWGYTLTYSFGNSKWQQVFWKRKIVPFSFFYLPELCHSCTYEAPVSYSIRHY